MDTIELTRSIFTRLGKYKWLILAAASIMSIAMFVYSKTIAPVYTTKATVFPLTGTSENPTSNAINTLLTGGEAPNSFSKEASINIVELAQSHSIIEAVVLKRLPAFGNKRIAELLIESYNKGKKMYEPAIKMPTDSGDLKAVGSWILKLNYTAKVLKSGIFEVGFSNTNKALLSPVTYELIEKISQFYIDMKIKKAKNDYDFTVKKIDSLQAILDTYDQQAIRMNSTTLFVPNSKMEYSIPKENLVNSKERVMRLRDASANNREEALWRLQKATPIIATLDKPEPPFIVKRASALIYAIIGFCIGAVIVILILIAQIMSRYVKSEATKAIFGEEKMEAQNPPIS